MNARKDIERHRSLRDLTTFGIGGPADYFIPVHDIAAMQEALLFCKTENLPYLILGKGSNVLLDDRGFAGVVIANRIQFLNKSEDESIWHLGAGYSFSLLGHQTARNDWSGLEFASGIPGSVGGAIYMNAGANGAETAQSLVSVDYVTEEGALIHLKKEEITFGYRFSSFQKMRGAIVGGTFQMEKKAGTRQKQLDIVHYRKKTQPYNAKSAGCLFRNPSCAHAGALIEQSGLKGKSIGDAQVSAVHANFIINKGSATTNEVLQLIAYICKEVKSQTGYDLEHEVRYIPYGGS